MSQPGENCSAACPTKDHQTFGECMRAKSLKVAYCNSASGHDYTRQKRWDNELQAYRDARAQGIQPAGTTTAKIREAVELSDMAGKAFDASTNTFSDKGV